MRKTSIAVAFAAAVTSFAVHAQEAPSSAAANSGLTKSAAAVSKPAADKKIVNASTPGRYSTGFSDRGTIAMSPTPVTAKSKAQPAKVATAKAQPAKTLAAKAKVAANAATSRRSPLADKASKRTSIAFTEQGMIEFTPGENGVDTVTTASVAVVKTPDLTKGGKTKVAVVTTGAYSAIIARYAAAYGVPASLAHAVIRVESNYRVNARGSAGEVGLMQIKPATARGLGYSGSAAGLFNPETNIRYGMKYLGMAHKLGGGSTCGTILKYNAGHGAKRMNPVSANYCAKVRRHMGA